MLQLWGYKMVLSHSTKSSPSMVQSHSCPNCPPHLSLQGPCSPITLTLCKAASGHMAIFSRFCKETTAQCEEERCMQPAALSQRVRPDIPYKQWEQKDGECQLGQQHAGWQGIKRTWMGELKLPFGHVSKMPSALTLIM